MTMLNPPNNRFEYLATDLAADLSTDEQELKQGAVETLISLTLIENGYQHVIECLSLWQRHLDCEQSLKPLLDELQQSGANRLNADEEDGGGGDGGAANYQLALIALLDCLLTSCTAPDVRRRLIEQIQDLNFTGVFEELRWKGCSEQVLEEIARFEHLFDSMVIANGRRVDSSSSPSPIGGRQTSVMDQRRPIHQKFTATRAVIEQDGPTGLFYTILKKVTDTPKESSFVNILQHISEFSCPKAFPLLSQRSESGDDNSSLCQWQLADRILHQINHLHTAESASHLLRLAEMAPVSPACCQCRCHDDNHIEHTDATVTNGDINGNGEVQQTVPPPPPPPLAPPPPPPPLLLAGLFDKTAKKEEFEDDIEVDFVAPLPKPKTKLKPFIWNKIDGKRILKRSPSKPTAASAEVRPSVGEEENIWMKGNKITERSAISLDFAKLEELFSAHTPTTSDTGGMSSSSGRLISVSDTPPNERKKKEEVMLLDGKRSLTVNIFLKQFKGDIDQEVLLDAIRNCCASMIGAERLRGLLTILPDSETLKTLQCYPGDYNRLGNAERFYMDLIEIPNYALRVEGMLLKEEFASVVEQLTPSLEAMITAAKDLKSCRKLQEVLHIVLMVGNYLNAGQYGGNAMGFELSSLWRLVEIRANRSNMNLLHFVAMEAEAKNPSLLLFAEQLPCLEFASKHSFNTISDDVRTLRRKVQKMTDHLKGSQNTNDMQFDINSFVEHAASQLIQLEESMAEVEKLRIELADFFCEDRSKFKLEECFRVFHGFATRFQKAVEENKQRKSQEEKVKMRQKQREEKQFRGRPRSSTEDERSSTSNSVLDGDKPRRTSLAEYLKRDADNRQHARSNSVVVASSQPSIAELDADTTELPWRRFRRRQAAWTNSLDRERTVEQTSSPAITTDQMSESMQIDKPLKAAHIRRTSSMREPTTVAESTDLNGLLEEWENDMSVRRRKKSSDEQIGAPPRFRSWRERIVEEMPDYNKYSKQNIGASDPPATSAVVDNVTSIRTDIDEVVRDCERTRDEIDRMGSEEPSNAAAVGSDTMWERRRSVRDSGIDDGGSSSDGVPPVRFVITAEQFSDGDNVSAQASPPQNRARSVGHCGERDEGFETDSQTTLSSSGNRSSPVSDAKIEETSAATVSQQPPAVSLQVETKKSAVFVPKRQFGYLRETKSSSPAASTRKATTTTPRATSVTADNRPVSRGRAVASTTMSVTTRNATGSRQTLKPNVTPVEKRTPTPHCPRSPDLNRSKKSIASTKSPRTPTSRPKPTPPPSATSVRSPVRHQSNADTPRRRVTMNKPVTVPGVASGRSAGTKTTAGVPTKAKPSVVAQTPAKGRPSAVKSRATTAADKRLERLLSPPKPRMRSAAADSSKQPAATATGSTGTQTSPRKPASASKPVWK